MIVNDYRKNLRGTNQYKAKKSWTQSTFLNLLFIPLVFGSIIAVQDLSKEVVKPTHADYVSPLPEGTETPFPISKIMQPVVKEAPVIFDGGVSDDKPERDEIKAYIKTTFGDYAPKAFALLKCENSTFNPDAVNSAGNYPEGSRDIGVFQINEYWQGVNAKFLFNYRINILMAKSIFDANNHTFSMWTCGRNLNI